MNSFKTLLGRDYIKAKLSLLWLFVTLNYIYADILSLMDATVLNDILTGAVGDGVEITPAFLFFGAILMEIPIAMVVLSLVLKRRINRWANILAAAIKTAAVAGSLFVGTLALYYLFFGIVEILTTLYIIWVAWTWKTPEAATGR